MAGFGFNHENVEPSVGFDVLPAGKYIAQIIQADDKELKNGNGRMTAVRFEITEGKFAKRLFFANLCYKHTNPDTQRYAQADIKAIINACLGAGAQCTDWEQLKNIPIEISVKVSRRKDTDEMQNEIKGYKPKAKQVASPPPNGATPPPPEQPTAPPSANPNAWQQQP